MTFVQTSTLVRLFIGGVGFAAAGHLGGLVGGFVAFSLASKEVKETAEKLSDGCGGKISESILGLVADSIAEKIKAERESIQSAYRKALAEALTEIQRDLENSDDFKRWFGNWIACLRSKSPLRLDDVVSSVRTSRDYEAGFRETLERLDSQGEQLREECIVLIPPDRALPSELFNEISNKLPDKFTSKFNQLIASSDYSEAFRVIELEFRERLLKRLQNQDAVLASLRAEVGKIGETMEALSLEIRDHKGDIAHIKSRLDQILTSVAQLTVAVKGSALATREPATDETPNWWDSLLQNSVGLATSGAQGVGTTLDWLLGSGREMGEVTIQQIWSTLAGTAASATDALDSLQKQLMN